MEDSPIESAETKKRYPVKGLVITTIVWAVLVAAILSWQAYDYSGVFGILAEWQFAQWDRMWPLATIALITFLLALPLLLLIGWRLRRRRNRYGSPGRSAVIRRDSRIAKGILWATGVAAVGAGLLALIGFAISGVSDKAAINLALDDTPPEGAKWVKMRGTVRYDRIGYYSERFVLIGRDLYVAPLTTGKEDNEIQYFVEIDPRESGKAPATETVEGIVRRASLPGGLEELYERENVMFEKPSFVVFRDKSSARWPFMSAAVDFLILALLFGLSFILFRIHLHRLAREEDPSDSSEQT